MTIKVVGKTPAGSQCYSCRHFGGMPKRYCKRKSTRNKKWMIVNNTENDCSDFHFNLTVVK